MNSNNQLDQKDKVARTGCWLMFIPLILGFFVATHYASFISIEIRRFHSKRHIQAITNAFQLELSPNETLRVSGYAPGGWQAPSVLRIVIEGIDSVDSFLSRLHCDIREIIRNSYVPPDEHGSFKAYEMLIFGEARRMDSYAKLSFFYKGNKLYAEIYMSTFPSGFGEVQRILNTYHTIWFSPFFLLPAMVQISIIVYRVVRVVRKKSRTL